MKLCEKHLVQSVALMILIAVQTAFTAAAVSLQKGDSLTYQFKGKLQASTPCNINNNKIMEISFGNVGINKVESGIYVRPIEYSLNCGKLSTSNTILMMLRGVTIPSHPDMIDSHIDGLWLQFYKDGVPLALNSEFSVADPLAPPKLDIKLVKEPGVNLADGAFNISATLVAEFI